MENQYFQNGQNHNEKVSELTIELDNLKNANDELKTCIEKLQAEKECLDQKLAEVEENHKAEMDKEKLSKEHEKLSKDQQQKYHQKLKKQEIEIEK